jgi:hypothetical protein
MGRGIERVNIFRTDSDRGILWTGLPTLGRRIVRRRGDRRIGVALRDTDKKSEENIL